MMDELPADVRRRRLGADEKEIIAKAIAVVKDELPVDLWSDEDAHQAVTMAVQILADNPDETFSWSWFMNEFRYFGVRGSNKVRVRAILNALVRLNVVDCLGTKYQLKSKGE